MGRRRWSVDLKARIVAPVARVCDVALETVAVRLDAYVEHLPFDQRVQLHQLMAYINQAKQARSEQVFLFRRTSAALHQQTKVA